MVEIRYTEISAALQCQQKEGFFPVYLVHGESFVSDAVVDRIAGVLGTPDSLEVLDGSRVRLRDALEEVNTFSLLSRGKVVVLQGARLFDTGSEAESLAEKAKKAVEKGNTKQAIPPFLRYLALKGMDLEALAGGGRKKKKGAGEEEWMRVLAEICLEKGVKVPSSADEGELLVKALEKGFPDGHYLVISVDQVDRRRAIYKKLAAAVCVVDGSVPSGNRRQDREARDEMMRQCLVSVLGKAGKTIEPRGVGRLLELTGFDLRMLSANLEKLVDFAGDRPSITLKDVEDVLQRTRQDPIFVFTGAVADRNVPEALLSMIDLVKDGMHPLQILSALVNQFRKLLIAMDFLTSSSGKDWSRRMAYDAFVSRVLPSLLDHEEALRGLRAEWIGTEEKGRKATDLSIAGNGKNPYPVYQILLRAERFEKEELIAAMGMLAEADLRMKSGLDGTGVLESVVIRIALGKEKAVS
ncbi:hypothetical protein OOT00_02700 [Desulfobotulus sp. H1]|uniref:DNA polymerase III delta subunit-like C-terminal domain-containing protein n=1 Tax=Desulfobotulus pelophilus TaxID=2823377 RepID=A0ABT3N611_9BACT|nr:hypothetical protein [Desulfobotulus pelophilus]MCW7752888.1 hypothetical protein [Desulfobotulus pelophilus]